MVNKKVVIAGIVLLGLLGIVHLFYNLTAKDVLSIQVYPVGNGIFTGYNMQVEYFKTEEEARQHGSSSVLYKKDHGSVKGAFNSIKKSLFSGITVIEDPNSPNTKIMHFSQINFSGKTAEQRFNEFIEDNGLKQI